MQVCHQIFQVHLFQGIVQAFDVFITSWVNPLPQHGETDLDLITTVYVTQILKFTFTEGQTTAQVLPFVTNLLRNLLCVVKGETAPVCFNFKKYYSGKMKCLREYLLEEKQKLKHFKGTLHDCNSWSNNNELSKCFLITTTNLKVSSL